MEEFRRYLKNIGHFPDFREEGFCVSALVEEIRKGKKEAASSLIESTVNYIAELAQSHCRQWNAWPHLMDLIQEANMEVSEKIENFDPSKGAFKSFVAYRSYVAFVRFWQNSKLVHVTEHGRKIMKHLQKVQSDLELELGREPTLSELSSRVGRDESQVYALQTPGGTTMLPLPEFDFGELGNIDFISYRRTEVDPLQALEATEIHKVLVECLGPQNADLLLTSFDGTDAFQSLYHQMYGEQLSAAAARKRKERLLEKLRACPQAKEKLLQGGYYG